MSGLVPPAASPVVLCTKVDTLGDLILFASALRALGVAWPEARRVVLIRGAYRDLAPLLAPGVEWLTTSLDPFTTGPAQHETELARLAEVMATLRPDLLVAATGRPNWLDSWVAVKSAATERIRIGHGPADVFFGLELERTLGRAALAPFTRNLPDSPGEPELARNLRLLEAASGRTLARQGDRLMLPDTCRQSAREIAVSLGLDPGHYAVVAAAGFAHVRLKTWPADRFAAVIRHLQVQHRLPVLLIGSEDERPYLEEVGRAAGGAAVWCGGTGMLPRLAGLVAGAALFVGNDTGAMHLAASLGTPLVAVFGGGTWPRFVPEGEASTAVVHPLPCFGCGWDCAFGDAPCLKEITLDDVLQAVDRTLAGRATERITAVQHLPAPTLVMMDKAATTYRTMRADHLARQQKLEELTELDREKDAAILEKETEIDRKEAEIRAKEAEIDRKEAALQDNAATLQVQDAAVREKEAEINAKQDEIQALKTACDERLALIETLDREITALRTEIVTVRADQALLENAVKQLPPDQAHAATTLAGQATHIRNLEALLHLRGRELDELKAVASNRQAGLHDLEQAKHYGRLLAEKEAVIQDLNRACQERQAVIQQLLAESTGVGSALAKMGRAATGFARARIQRPLAAWLRQTWIEGHWMQLGVLRQHPPRALRWDARLEAAAKVPADAPFIGVVTPSYGQEAFIERTLRSVLDQRYPRLKYVVQDGGSRDGSPGIIARHAAQLAAWASEPDQGQADAIRRGFDRLKDELAPTDLMGWLNSDDLLAPGALATVARYFATHPEVDVVYGHRIVIDEQDREVGRWILPPHDPHALEWVDYVPQETLFWRKRSWDLVGGIDPTFQFALDWDLLARFQQAGCRMVRLPYFLGAFRVHSEQKTSQAIHSVGADEMRRIRLRFHGERHDDSAAIEMQARRMRTQGVITARLHAVGIRR